MAGHSSAQLKDHADRSLLIPNDCPDDSFTDSALYKPVIQAM